MKRAGSGSRDLPGRLLAAALVLALTLAGVGRGIAFPDAEITGAIPGPRVPICHTTRPVDAGHPADPTHRPDCCEACALLAAAILPDAPAIEMTSAAPRAAEAEGLAAQVTVLRRLRTPRQPQGPPAA